MALTLNQRMDFLTEPHVATISVDAGPDRGPLSVPIWFGYRLGEDPWVLTPAESRKARLIRAAGRFTLLSQRVTPTVRYVSIEGPVSGIQPADESDLRTIAARYLPPDAVAPYVDFALADHGSQVVIRMRPEHWLSADLG